MKSNPSVDNALPTGDAATHPPHHPAGHGLLDNEEVAAQDELQHEAALRDSALRVPR